MNKLVMAFCLTTALTISIPCQAKGTNSALVMPPASKMKELNNLFSILKVDADINRSWRGLVTTLKIKLIKNLFLEYSKDEALTRKERFSKAREEANKVMANFSKKAESSYKTNLKKIYIHVYSKYYSTSDLKSLSSFYTSSAGIKATGNSQRIIRESMFKISRKLRPKVEEIIDEKIDEMFGGGEEEGSGIVDDIMD